MQARHGQLNAMGWFGNVGIATPTNPADMQPAGDALLTSMFPPPWLSNPCSPLCNLANPADMQPVGGVPLASMLLPVCRFLTPAHLCVTCLSTLQTCSLLVMPYSPVWFLPLCFLTPAYLFVTCL